MSKNEITGRVLRMMSKNGFVDLFWSDLAEAQREDPKATRKDVFDNMNAEYAEAIGELRYRDFESFRKGLV